MSKVIEEERCEDGCRPGGAVEKFDSNVVSTETMSLTLILILAPTTVPELKLELQTSVLIEESRAALAVVQSQIRE